MDDKKSTKVAKSDNKNDDWGNGYYPYSRDYFHLERINTADYDKAKLYDFMRLER